MPLEGFIYPKLESIISFYRVYLKRPGFFTRTGGWTYLLEYEGVDSYSWKLKQCWETEQWMNMQAFVKSKSMMEKRCNVPNWQKSIFADKGSE